MSWSWMPIIIPVFIPVRFHNLKNSYPDQVLVTVNASDSDEGLNGTMGYTFVQNIANIETELDKYMCGKVMP